MSAEDSSNQQSSPVPTRRRSSFTTNRLSEMFSSVRNPTSGSPPNSPPSQNSPSFNQNVFGNGNQASSSSPASGGRRMSISTLGLSGSTSFSGSMPSGPYSASGPGSMWGLRRGSTSTGPPSNASSDESAIDESADPVSGSVVNASGPSPGGRRGSGAGNAPPSSPLGRRMSFGARAMGQMRNEGQGFNWADNLRNRQSRSGSSTLGGGGGLMSPTRTSAPDNFASPPNQAPAPKEPALLPKREGGPLKKPDHFQERILKGDFYMD